MPHYIGLMSGTSADGIDAVLVDFVDKKLALIDTEFLAYTDSVKNRIQQLQIDASHAYSDLAELDIELGLLAGDVVNILRRRNPNLSVIAIGSHGQTIQHRPNSEPAYTLQIGNGATIVEKTGIFTINDFRSRDIALGGEGAPFAPLFHQAFFADKQQNRAIVNIGGIANISHLKSNGNTIGFDTGPGNTLIDLICRKEFNQSYDVNGEIAQTGTINQTLLESLLSDPYFISEPPKSTGQEYFNEKWLAKYLNKQKQSVNQVDLLATLTQLTASSITKSLNQFCPDTEAVYVCGGGSHNQAIMDFLKQNSNYNVETTSALGVNPDWVEACGFAWLAKQAMENKTVDLRKITGANKPCILGCIWPVS